MAVLQVIFDFAQPLFIEARSALQGGKKVVLITGTPGVGKSSLRNVHAHLLLSDARRQRKRCCLLFAKSAEDNMIRLHLAANGSYHVELVKTDCAWVSTGYIVFKPGDDLFILADISKGVINNMRGPGLILYSSPNQKLADLQIMKESSKTLGYPILTRDQVCRYTNTRMGRMFERYGGLVSLVWGDNEETHKSWLRNKLQDVDGFLKLLGQETYLKGPHFYFYTQLKHDSDGSNLFDLERNPP